MEVVISKWRTAAILNFIGSNNFRTSNDRHIEFGIKKDISEHDRVIEAKTLLLMDFV